MKLFHSQFFKPCGSENLCVLATPLGNLALIVQDLLSKQTLNSGSRCFQHVSRAAKIYQSYSSTCILEVLHVDLASQQSLSSLKVTCEAMIVRLHCYSGPLSLRIALSWLPGSHWTASDVESGEGLAARTWTDEQVIASIGTEDVEYLASRARREIWMPHRFSQLLSNHEEIIQLAQEGVSVLPPSLENGDLLQVHFVVASARQNTDGVSTWLAVDQRPSFLLDSADCK